MTWFFFHGRRKRGLGFRWCWTFSFLQFSRITAAGFTQEQKCMQTYCILSGLHRTGIVLAFEIWKGMQRGSLRVRHTTVKFEPDDPAVYFIKLVWVNRVIELQSRNMWFCWPFLSISICQGGFSQSVPLVACTMKPSNLPSDVCLRWPLALTSEVSSFLTHWEGLNINMTRVHQLLNMNSRLNGD